MLYPKTRSDLETLLVMFDRIEGVDYGLYNRAVTKTVDGIEVYVYEYAKASELHTHMLIEDGMFEEKA